MRRYISVIFLAAFLGVGAALAEFGGSYLVPLDHDAIQYSKAPADDPIARLGRSVAQGEVKLDFETNGMGHLRALLKNLGVSIDSQVLVFSKTSFQGPLISPRSPRSIYFGDDVSVGWVRGGEVLELAAVDPKQGVIFYTLDIDDVAKPRFDRRDNACLQCHHAGGTLGVPGIFVRSVYPEPSGMPLFQSGGFLTDHRSPMNERWGGWYVSGKHGGDRHMGNAVVRDRDKPGELESDGTQNLTSLAGKFDTGAYLSPYSDIVALMTLEHQTHMTNLLTRAGWEARLAFHYQDGVNKATGQTPAYIGDSVNRRLDSAVQELLEYMLFLDEPPLKDRIEGVSGFSSTFARRGPRDKQGRSLRDFDLQRRLFRYPLSYMIYSEQFDALPEIVRERFYHRLHAVLSGQDHSPRFGALRDGDRQDILEIVRDTKPHLPEYWR